MIILKRIFIFIFIIASIFLITSCKREETLPIWEQAPIIPPTRQTTDDYFPLTDILHVNPVDLVKVVTYNEYLEKVYVPLFFTQHGLMKGNEFILVPLTEQTGSVFNQLGMTVEIDISGTEATIMRGRKMLTFSEGMLGMFINREESVYLSDMPIKYRGTLYVPLEPILNAFDIPWSIEYNILIIGG